MRACVICISKNAHDTINDWIDYYLNLGFIHIFLFDNNDYENKYHIDNKNVSVIPYHNYTLYCGSPEWRQAYLCKIGLMFAFDHIYDYAFICDDDEYLNFNGKYSCINDFLNVYKDYNNIILYQDNITDNGYLYIKDEPQCKNLREIYTQTSHNHPYYKSIYKIPVSEEFRKIIYTYNNNIMHYVTNDNYIIIDADDISIYHYKTYCMERYLLKKSKYGGYSDILTDKNLEYYLKDNECTTERLKAYVDLCCKYNLQISNNDKYILDSHNIKY